MGKGGKGLGVIYGCAVTGVSVLVCVCVCVCACLLYVKGFVN
jgi:hypothetical protein